MLSFHPNASENHEFCRFPSKSLHNYAPSNTENGAVTVSVMHSYFLMSSADLLSLYFSAVNYLNKNTVHDCDCTVILEENLYFRKE